MSQVTYGEERFSLNLRAGRENWRVGVSSVTVPVTDRGEVVAVVVGPEGFEEIRTFDRHQQAAVEALGLSIATI
jgi:hypothetical protein